MVRSFSSMCHGIPSITTVHSGFSDRLGSSVGHPALEAPCLAAARRSRASATARSFAPTTSLTWSGVRVSTRLRSLGGGLGRLLLNSPPAREPLPERPASTLRDARSRLGATGDVEQLRGVAEDDLLEDRGVLEGDQVPLRAVLELLGAASCGASSLFAATVTSAGSEPRLSPLDWALGVR